MRTDAHAHTSGSSAGNCGYKLNYTHCPKKLPLIRKELQRNCVDMLEADTQEYLLRGRERDVNSAPGLYGRSAKKGGEKRKKAAFRGVKYRHEASHPATSRLAHCPTELDTANTDHVVCD